MSTWTNDELRRVGEAEEFQNAVSRRDGTLRKAVPIWVVRIDDELYVRSYRGRSRAWFRAAQVNRQGHIYAGGIEKDVTFVDELDSGINDQVDAAYHDKYGRYPQYVAPLVIAEARSTTIKLVPCSINA